MMKLFQSGLGWGLGSAVLAILYIWVGTAAFTLWVGGFALALLAGLNLMALATNRGKHPIRLWWLPGVLAWPAVLVVTERAVQSAAFETLSSQISPPLAVVLAGAIGGATAGALTVISLGMSGQQFRLLTSILMVPLIWAVTIPLAGLAAAISFYVAASLFGATGVVMGPAIVLLLGWMAGWLNNSLIRLSQRQETV